MKIKKSTYEKLVRRRRWLANIVNDLDTIIKEIDKENKKKVKKCRN